MNKKEVIYFTKEDGKNKFLTTSICFITSIDTEKIDNPIFEKILGHKPTNLYAWVDGTEFEILGQKGN